MKWMKIVGIVLGMAVGLMECEKSNTERQSDI